VSQPPAVTISCSDCRLEHTDACADCVVSFLLDRQPGDAVVLDADEARALRLLGRARLVPRLRHLSA
jgi:Zn-finger protein